MCLGCLALCLAAGFISEIPPTLAAKFAPECEYGGEFRMVRQMPEMPELVSRGEYRKTRGEFVWRTTEPFVTEFRATPERYAYSNEDEMVSRRLDELPRSAYWQPLLRGDLSELLKFFDALYEEIDGRMYLRAKPKASELKRFVERLDFECDATNWCFEAVLPARGTLKVVGAPAAQGRTVAKLWYNCRGEEN